jgi:polysaccharide chain length determinant protein (PEP-CTERM system associated)
MQPTADLTSTPRRPLDVEDYIDIVRRHRSWIAGPAFAALVISVVVAFFWPDSYVSLGAIRVVPPQVPERFVPSNVNVEMSQHINSMAQGILSRTMLTNIVQTHGLYRRELSRRPMEDIIELMRRKIRIGNVLDVQAHGRGTTSAFTIAFEYENRYLAQKVTSDLMSRFITENLRVRANQSRETTQFLKEQWEAAKKRLEELENKRTQFRLQNAGRLPDDLQANLQTLRTLEMQLASTNETISRIGQEKLLMESQIRIYQDQLNSLGSASEQLGASVKSERLVQLERQILGLQTTLSSLRERYRDSYPDVKRMESQIEVLKKLRDDLLKQPDPKKPETPEASAGAKPNPVAVRGGRELEAAIARLQSTIQAKDLELEERQKEQAQLKSTIKGYNSRIEARPVMEQEYADLMRDYNLAKARYDDLNMKMSQSEIATDLENRNQSETLEVLDPASLPETPTKPNRWLIVGIGLSLGIMLGGAIAGGREVKDTSLKNLKDARAYTNLPVLGTVPLLENDLVVRRKRRLAWLAWSAACMLGILAMTSSIYYYYASKT